MYTLYATDEYGSDFPIGEFADVQEARRHVENALEVATGGNEIASLKNLLLQIEWDSEECED